MYAIRTSCPYSVNGRYDERYGYGQSSQLMLPGVTSVGVATAAACACAPASVVSALRRTASDDPEKRSSAITSAFFMACIINRFGTQRDSLAERKAARPRRPSSSGRGRSDRYGVQDVGQAGEVVRISRVQRDARGDRRRGNHEIERAPPASLASGRRD